MALYHLHVSVGSKAKGQSAKAKHEYVAREGRYAKDSRELLYIESGNMPAWVASPKAYWEKADVYERANGRLFVEVEFALPKELDEDERVGLAREFAKSLTDTERLPYTLSIHRGKGHNPHAHLVISERKNDGIERAPDRWFRRYDSNDSKRGGAQKSETLSNPEWLQETRETWAKMANEALERVGLQDRIDHRSYKDQGIDKIPGQHIGPNVIAMDERARAMVQAQRLSLFEKLYRPHRLVKILEVDQWRAKLEEYKKEKQQLEVQREQARKEEEEARARRAEDIRDQNLLRGFILEAERKESDPTEREEDGDERERRLRLKYAGDIITKLYLYRDNESPERIKNWMKIRSAKYGIDEVINHPDLHGEMRSQSMGYRIFGDDQAEAGRKLLGAWLEDELNIPKHRRKYQEDNDVKNIIQRAINRAELERKLREQPSGPTANDEPEPPKPDKKPKHRLTRYPRGGGIEF